MTVRRRKLVLHASAVGVATLAMGVILAGLLAPTRPDVPSVEAVVQPAGAATRGGRATPGSNGSAADAYSLAQLQRVASMPLRQTLFPEDEPDPVLPNRPVVNTGRPLSVQLLGTVIEPGKSMAFFKDSDQSVKLIFVGETADTVGGPVTVTDVVPRRVTLEHAGTTRQLAMPNEDEGGQP